MSFICQICKKSQENGTKAIQIVLKTKDHEHPLREGVYSALDPETGEIVKTNDPGGFGTQIVKEMRICPKCNDKREKQKKWQQIITPRHNKAGED